MAENQVSTENMAVSAIEPTTVSLHNDFKVLDTDPDKRAIETNPKKKSCFQITRVITKQHGGNDHADGDLDDDLDETNTEEASSVSFDASKTNDTDYDHQSDDTLSAQSTPLGNDEFLLKDLNKGNGVSSTPLAVLSYPDNKAILANHTSEPGMDVVSNDKGQMMKVPDLLAIPSEAPRIAHTTATSKEKPSESRFKVVKIESKEPFRRGRWSCQDYLDPPSTDKGDKDKPIEEINSVGSGNSSNASSVHFVPGVDDPSRNPMGDCQNGDYNTAQSQVIYNSGSHIANKTNMPSQHIPSQVPNSVTQQTHLQTILPQSEMGSQFVPSGTMLNGQSPNTQSFSQGIMPPPPSSQQGQALDTGTDYIPNNARHHNAQQTTTQDNALTQQVQSSTSQEFNTNVQQQQQQNFRSQNVEVRATNSGGSGGENITNAASNNDYISPDTIPYASTTSGADKPMVEESENRDPSQKGASSASIRPLQQLAPPLLEMVSQRINNSDKDDDSGASTVAIDNKIEQAMDLVKSHLMFAVREEVDVLREQIKELLEKNSQLEYENQMLRQSASPETLTKLQQPRPVVARSQNPPPTSTS